MTFIRQGGRARLELQQEDGRALCYFPCQSIDPEDAGAECFVHCRQPGTPKREGPDWEYEGTPDAPTLTPSINCRHDSCWHGYIVNGNVQAEPPTDGA